MPRTLGELIGGGVAAAGLVTVGRWAGPEAAFAGLGALIVVFLGLASAVARPALRALAMVEMPAATILDEDTEEIR